MRLPSIPHLLQQIGGCTVLVRFPRESCYANRMLIQRLPRTAVVIFVTVGLSACSLGRYLMPWGEASGESARQQPKSGHESKTSSQLPGNYLENGNFKGVSGESQPTKPAWAPREYNSVLEDPAAVWSDSTGGEKPVSMEAYCRSCAALPAASGQQVRAAGQNAEIVTLLPLKPCCRGGVPAALSINKAGEVVLWNLQLKQGTVVFRVPGEFGGAVFSQTGRRLAVAHGPNVTVFELYPGGVHYDLTRLRGNIASLDFDPEERFLVLGSADGKLYRWKFAEAGRRLGIRESERLLERYHGLTTIVSAVAYHPFGRVFFSGDWNGTLVAWSAYDANIFGGEYGKNLFGPRFFAELATQKVGERSPAERVEQLSVSEDGRAIALVLQNGIVEFWKVRGFSRVAAVQAHPGLVYSVAISPDSGEVASVGRDGRLKWWTVERKKQRDKAFELVEKGELAAPELRVLRYLDNKALLGAGRDGRLFVLDAALRRAGEDAVAGGQTDQSAASALAAPEPTPAAAAPAPTVAAAPSPQPTAASGRGVKGTRGGRNKGNKGERKHAS